jgi:hypothetical protein
LIGGIAELLEAARRNAARTVNALMTATYWEIGRRIVEFEQSGEARAEYGEELLARLESDLTSRFGRGFSRSNLQSMRLFYVAFPPDQIRQTLSGKSKDAGNRTTQSLASGTTAIGQTPSGKSRQKNSATVSRKFEALIRNFALSDLAGAFPLPWSHYVRLLSVKNSRAREFYHTEALRGGWSVRQLDRQIASQFYERTALSKNKTAMLRKGAVARAGDSISADEEVRDRSFSNSLA